MWPVMLLPADVNVQLQMLTAAALILVYAVLVAGSVHFCRNRRRLRTVTCPEDGDRALVAVRGSPDGPTDDVVVDCSRWHDGERDCGHGCLRRTR
jgi:hypothetical protein